MAKTNAQKQKDYREHLKMKNVSSYMEKQTFHHHIEVPDLKNCL